MAAIEVDTSTERVLPVFDNTFGGPAIYGLLSVVPIESERSQD